MIPFPYIYGTTACRAYLIEHFPGPEYDRYLIKSGTDLIILAATRKENEKSKWIETPELTDALHPVDLIEAMGEGLAVWMNFESF